MKNELVKFDAQSVTERIEKAEVFTKKVVDKVAEIAPRIPSNLTELDVLNGDAFEENVSKFVNAVSSQAKALKEERLEVTRKLDEIKSLFTTNEKTVENQLLPLTTFVNGWNGEKLRRKRIEDQKLEKERERKNLLIDFGSTVKNHYTDMLANLVFGSKQKIENDFYNLDEAGLIKFNETVIEIDNVKKSIRERFIENEFNFDKTDEELKEIHAAELKSVAPLFQSSCEEVLKKFQELKSFVPSRVNQIKEQDESSKLEEQAKLKAKQEKEKLEAEAKLKQQQEDEHLEKKINSAIESAEAKPMIDISKGVSAKLKYKPETHAQLLKMVQHYIGDHYLNEDFEKLNARLSFMRTACDSDLNKDGTIIEGVPTEEIITKRKSNTTD